jgi:lipopolysaccharide/colanic/teichoic acid biosynthesis glycosyltransferase
VTKRAEAVKRTIDVVVALALVLLTLPVMIVAAVGIAVSLRTSPFFSHTRIGLHGKPFRMVKFRTLPATAPAYAGKYEIREINAPWFCRTLRALHLDELPQLFLVLSGAMSLVGPRPEMSHLYDEFDPGFAALRVSVRPGCTGLWQVSDRCDRMIHEHPEFDEWYLEHRSVRVDLWILARSVLVMSLPAGRRRPVSYEELLDRPETVAAPIPVLVRGPGSAEAVESRVEALEAS